MVFLSKSNPATVTARASSLPLSDFMGFFYGCSGHSAGANSGMFVCFLPC